MKFLFAFLFGFCLCFAAFCHADNAHTTNTLAPILKLQAIPKTWGDSAAVAFSGEVGRFNYRAGGTFGFLLGEQNYFKASSEYLVQKLGYHFVSGTTHHWMHMVDVAGAYKRVFSLQWLPSASLSGYWAASPSKMLHTEFVASQNEIVTRRIAGAHAAGGSFGAIFKPFCKTALDVLANYDHVTYQRKYQPRRHVSGWGGTFDLSQMLNCDWRLQLRAELRRPFNYFLGSLNWNPSRCGWLVGFFGSYTKGKTDLPNSTAAGVQISYAWGKQPCASKRSTEKTLLKNSEDNKAKNFQSTELCATECCPKITECCSNPCLIEWVSSPAVYFPEVLAIVDPKVTTMTTVTTTCVPLTSSTQTVSFTFVGDTTQVSLIGNPTPPITFSSSDTSVATVDGSGLVTFQSNGDATIFGSNCGQPPVVVLLVVPGG